MGRELDLQPAVVVHLVQGVDLRRPAQQRLHAGEQLAVAERLGEIIVGSGAQPSYLL